MRTPRARARQAQHAPRSSTVQAAGTASLLAAATAAHQRGDLEGARAGYSQVLERDPANFDALHLLGVVAAQIGQPQVAVRMIEVALRIRPRSHEALNNLASALSALGENAAAEAALRSALSIAPRHTDALQNLSGLLLESGRFNEALELLTRAQQIAPKHPGILNNLGNAWRKLDRPAEAEQFFRQALTHAPAHVQALLNLGRLLLDRRCFDEAHQFALRAIQAVPGSGAGYRLLGNAHEANGRREQAQECYQHALALDPGDAAACSHLGLTILDGGDTASAMPYLRRAAELAPRDPDVLVNLARGAIESDEIHDAWDAARRAVEIGPRHVVALVNLGAVERTRGNFLETERHCRSALAVAPGWRLARVNLATVLLEMGRHDEAEQVLDAMLAADATDTQAHWLRALSRLARGQMKTGWESFEWRWRLPSAPLPRASAEPEWRGSPLRNRSLRLWPEQGLGDELQFASMIPDLVARQARITLECDARLCGLYQRSFPEVRVVPTGSTSNETFEFQNSLGSLAQWLRTNFDDFPAAKAGYLVPDPARREHWRAWLASLGHERLRVGISWRSHNLRAERRLACAELMQWRPVLDRPNTAFICLQYDDCQMEREALERDTGIRLIVPPGLDQRNDLDGVAALLAEIDLVITAPTTVSVLSGAVGAPTWQLNSGIDWHGLNRPYLPWQPSVRRFYKPWDRTWDDELALVAAGLDCLQGAPGTPSS